MDKIRIFVVVWFNKVFLAAKLSVFHWLYFSQIQTNETAVQGYIFRSHFLDTHLLSFNTSIFIIYFFLTCEIDGGGVAINDGLDKRQILHECETFFRWVKNQKNSFLFLMTFVEDKINILEAKKEWEFLCCLEGKCGISVNIRKTSRESCWKTDLLMIFRRCISNIISVLESHLDTLEEAKPGSQGMKCLLLHQSIVTCILPLILRSATYNSKSPKKPGKERVDASLLFTQEWCCASFLTLYIQ